MVTEWEATTSVERGDCATKDDVRRTEAQDAPGIFYTFFFCSTKWLFTIMLRVTATNSRSTFDVPPQPLWALSLANARWGRFLVIFFLRPALMPRRSHNLRTTTPSQAKVRGGLYTQHRCLPFENFRRGIYFIIFIYII